MVDAVSRRMVRASSCLAGLLWASTLAVELLVRDTPGTSSHTDGIVVSLLNAAVFISFPVAGAIILSRQRGNVVGWLLLAIGVGWGTLGAATAWADYGLLYRPGSLPAADVAGLLTQVLWVVPLGVTGTFLPLVFPDGGLASRSWRWAAYAGGASVTLILVLGLLAPGTVAGGPLTGKANPLGVEALRPVTDRIALVIVVFGIAFLASAASVFWRYRRSAAIPREQIKWLAGATAVIALVYAADVALSVFVAGSGPEPRWLLALDRVSTAVLVLIPGSIGVAVLRYRLWDIDVIIRRTLTYTALVAVLAAIYLAGVAAAGSALRLVTGSSGTVAVTLSTVAVAFAFQPLRRAIRHHVDRRFYRASYDARTTVEAFNERLREQIDVDVLCAELQAVVRDAIQPAHTSVWLRR